MCTQAPLFLKKIYNFSSIKGQLALTASWNYVFILSLNYSFSLGSSLSFRKDKPLFQVFLLLLLTVFYQESGYSQYECKNNQPTSLMIVTYSLMFFALAYRVIIGFKCKIPLQQYYIKILATIGFSFSLSLAFHCS